jgi:hypothetical protein
MAVELKEAVENELISCSEPVELQRQDRLNI